MRAVKPLSADNLYDISSDRLTVFLADLDDRIVASRWEGIFSIPDNVAAAAPNLRTLTTDYGVVTLGQINDHAETYLPNNDRNCQNAFQAFNSLMNSLDNKAKMRINLKRDLFVIDGVGHGPLLLKVIVQTAYVDTRSTVLHLQEQLSRLDVYIKDVKSDVEVFNDHVRTMVYVWNSSPTSSLSFSFFSYSGPSTQSFIQVQQPRPSPSKTTQVRFQTSNNMHDYI